MYISPFTTSRTFTVRLLPPRLPGRMSGSTWLHSSSVKSLGYRSLLRSYRARFSIVHIGDLSTTQATILASQTLDPIQYVPEQALSEFAALDQGHKNGPALPQGLPARLAIGRAGEEPTQLGDPTQKGSVALEALGRSLKLGREDLERRRRRVCRGGAVASSSISQRQKA